MTRWEKKIIDTFISHYFSGVDEAEENRKSLRIRSSIFFSNFETTTPDEKESYLEAAESLKHKGVIKLNWEKHGKGERLKTITCEHFEKLFEEAGKPHPRAEVETIKKMFSEKLNMLRKSPAAHTDKVINFMEYASIHFGSREIGQGLNQHVMEEFIHLLEFICEPAQLERITTRALSILLYRDSKHLENLLALCKPFLSRVQKAISCPDFSFLERSYPEIMISGEIIIEFKNKSEPLTNSDGHILGFPLETAEEFTKIKLISEKREKTVLTIENKETFYALGSAKNLPNYDCLLYIGGYLNRAAAALIKILSASGFTFYHAGDLDPDGILILQQIHDIAEKPVIPLRMDTATFDQYQTWGRTLTKPMLHQIKKIREETRAISGLADLVRCIEKTGLGIEQEIIDYR